MESKLFINWSPEEFIGMWDSVPYKFAPGQTVYLEDWKANHFAKHLTDRELNRASLSTADQKRSEFYAKCFAVETPEAEPPMPELAEMPVETQILNKNKKLGRPKKVVQPEEQFEGLEK